MNKFFLKTLAPMVLAGTIAAPVFAQSQPIRFVEVADMQAATESIQTACTDKPMFTEEWRQCVTTFARIDDRIWNEHRRVTINREGMVFSISLPFHQSWRMGDKPVRPYAIDNLTLEESQHPGAMVFGPVNVACYGIQDGYCDIDRPYAMSIGTQSINARKADLDKVVAGHKKDGTFEGEELPYIETIIGGKRVVLAPKIIENSGGAYMRYGTLLVAWRNGYIELKESRLTGQDFVDVELWRVAASIR